MYVARADLTSMQGIEIRGICTLLWVLYRHIFLNTLKVNSVLLPIWKVLLALHAASLACKGVTAVRKCLENLPL